MLNLTARRWLKVVHLCFVGLLLGGLAAVLLIHLTMDATQGHLFSDTFTMLTLFNQLVSVAFYGVVLTALGFSLFTPWGMTKHWWIIAKWVGLLITFAVVWIWVGPAIGGMVALADMSRDTALDQTGFENLATQLDLTLVGVLILVAIIMAISVFKPWGKRNQSYEIRRGMLLTLFGLGLAFSLVMVVLGQADMRTYRNLPVSTPDLSQLADGRYEGSTSYAGFTYGVAVEVKEGGIHSIEVLENRDSPYARYAEGILPRVLKYQSPDVDAITGATTTSKCLMLAIESALKENQSER